MADKQRLRSRLARAIDAADREGIVTLRLSSGEKVRLHVSRARLMVGALDEADSPEDFERRLAAVWKA